YGGTTGSGVLNDLWTLDVGTMTWTQQAVPTVNPGGVFLGLVAYAPTTGCGYIVYGLTVGSAPNAGTWQLCFAVTGGSRTTPTVGLAAAPNPSTTGATVVFTASVTGTVPTGTVSFSSDGSAIAACGAVSLTGTGNGRVASCSTSALTTGTHAIVA